MYLKSDKIVATIKGVTFRSWKLTGAAQNFMLDDTAITGWFDGAGARRESTQRPISHGDFADPATLAARVISITGVAVASTRAELQKMRDDFIGLLSDGEYTTLTVETGADVRTATVGIEGTPSWIHQHDTIATFKLDMFAPDPRIYGVERRLSLPGDPIDGGMVYTSNPPTPFVAPYYLEYPLDFGTAIEHQTQSALNSGNVDAWPVITVTGDFYDGFTVTDNLGHSVSYIGDVSSVSPVTIDFKTGSATQGGADRSTFLTKREWWPIPAGQSIQPSFLPSQSVSGWCDIIYRDTWI